MANEAVEPTLVVVKGQEPINPHKSIKVQRETAGKQQFLRIENLKSNSRVESKYREGKHTTNAISEETV